MMDSKPNGNTAPERLTRPGNTAPERLTRPGNTAPQRATRPAGTGPPGPKKPAAPGPKKRPPGPKKFSWKPILGTLVAVVIIWQLSHVLTQHQGKTNAGASQNSTSGPVAPTAPPTPTPTVTLGGHAVAAGGGPVIVLNPGLVAPGGYVEVEGSGFDPATTVSVWLKSGKAGKGGTSTLVAHGKTAKWGILSTGFHMPSSVNMSNAIVVAQEAGGKKTATATLSAPGGVGTASIIGKAAGKPGSMVTVNATGFGPGEPVNVYWGRVSGTPAAQLTANSSGDIRDQLKVGIAPVGPTTLVLVGQRTKTTATAPYLMLGLYPSTAAHPWAMRAGHSMTFTGSGFAPSEQILIFLNSNRGVPALTTTASSQGGFSVSFVVPFGLKGVQHLTAMGNQSRASVTSGFTVLPYDPSAQASTYGALPGTTVSFYAKGFSANEVVEVFTGGGEGKGTLVTAFRVNAEGSASAQGSYVVPSGVGPALIFTLVGQQSGGTATAKISVSGANGGASVPPQKPYVLPPSLGGKPSPAPSHSGGSGSQSGKTSSP